MIVGNCSDLYCRLSVTVQCIGRQCQGYPLICYGMNTHVYLATQAWQPCCLSVVDFNRQHGVVLPLPLQRRRGGCWEQ